MNTCVLKFSQIYLFSCYIMYWNKDYLVTDSATTGYAWGTISLCIRFILGFIKRKEGHFLVCLINSVVIMLIANNVKQWVWKYCQVSSAENTRFRKYIIIIICNKEQNNTYNFCSLHRARFSEAQHSDTVVFPKYLSLLPIIGASDQLQLFVSSSNFPQ